jgi:hypothetical protein
MHLSTSVTPQPDGLGPVEAGVEAEIAELSEARPGLAQTALATARVLDNPRLVSSLPAAAKVLTVLLDRLGPTSARGRPGVCRGAGDGQARRRLILRHPTPGSCQFILS